MLHVSKAMDSKHIQIEAPDLSSSLYHNEGSENHKPQVHPNHVREIGQSVRYLTKQKIEL